MRLTHKQWQSLYRGHITEVQTNLLLLANRVEDNYPLLYQLKLQPLLNLYHLVHQLDLHILGLQVLLSGSIHTSEQERLML